MIATDPRILLEQALDQLNDEIDRLDEVDALGDTGSIKVTVTNRGYPFTQVLTLQYILEADGDDDA